MKIPLFTQMTVKLYIRTEWFRRSFCDKIISLFIIDTYENEYNDNVIITRNYDCSWYEYNELQQDHKICVVDEFYDF